MNPSGVTGMKTGAWFSGFLESYVQGWEFLLKRKQQKIRPRVKDIVQADHIGVDGPLELRWAKI